jgi:prolyl 4-hydroxylase
LDFKVRCPFDPAAPGVWQAGDLDRMFERIVADPTYQVTIHSSPAASTHEESDNKNNCPFQGPWVLTLDDFLTPAECDRLIALGHAQGYERSTGLGTQLYDGTFAAANMTFRTSATAWCDGNCSNDALAVSVHDKIAALTGIHIGNSENLQLLRYEEGQFYKLHNDFIPFHFDRPQGVRILTVFLYLSDVEAGGGTNFPLLNNLTVLPKRGRVVVWPSVTSERPNIVDTRTMHQALVVEKGIKYSANSWLHQKNIKIPMKTLCHQ